METTNTQGAETVETILGGDRKFPYLPNIVVLADMTRAVNQLKSSQALSKEQHAGAIKLIGMASQLYLASLEMAVNMTLAAYQAAQPKPPVVTETK